MKIIKHNIHAGITWKDYKIIATELERLYSNEDVMMLHRDKLIALIQAIPNFKDVNVKPAPYMLDDIRFEWFFQKKGTGERVSHRRLKSSF